MESITVCYRRMAKSDLKGLLELSQDPHFLAGYGQTTDWPTTPEQILNILGESAVHSAQLCQAYGTVASFYIKIGELPTRRKSVYGFSFVWV